MRKKTKSLFTTDSSEFEYSGYNMSIIEEETDEPIGNFTGLYSKEGRPLFRPKERIGFKTWK